MPWLPLTGDSRIRDRCASEGCAGQPTWRLEAGGIGSDYCSGCKEKIESDPHWSDMNNAGREPIRETITFTFDNEAQRKRFHERLNHIHRKDDTHD